MRVHNKRKVLRFGRYISKGQDLLYKGLTVVATTSLALVFVSPILVRSGVGAQEEVPMVLAGPRSVEVVEVEKPVETEFESEKHEILAYIVEKFGEDSADAITLVRKCENSTFDQTRTNHNNNGSVDYGVFQINSIHTARFGEEFKTDWKANVDVAYEIFSEQGWSPWACSSTIGVKSFWE